MFGMVYGTQPVQNHRVSINRRELGVKIDIRRVEYKRKDQEKEMTQVTKSLELSLARFKEALQYRNEQRNHTARMIDNATSRRDEAIGTLKVIDKKLEETKANLVTQKHDLKILAKQEAVAKGMYTELLAGRLPMDADYAKTARLKSPDDLAAQKEKFLMKIESLFDKLDDEMADLSRRIRMLEKLISGATRRVELLNQKRGILSRSLQLYKKELAQLEKTLASTIEEEELLIHEYTDFTQRLKTVATIPASVDKLLARTLKSGKQANTGVA